MARFDLGDEEWAAIRRHLPQQGRGPQRRDDRTVLNGIFHILRTGVPWRDLPGRYGPPTTIYNRYVRWGERGIWQRILDALATECEDALIFIDSSIVKAQRAAVGSKGGSWRKVLDAHAAVAAGRFTQPQTIAGGPCGLRSPARKPMTAGRLGRSSGGRNNLPPLWPIRRMGRKPSGKPSLRRARWR